MSLKIIVDLQSTLIPVLKTYEETYIKLLQSLHKNQ